MSESQDVTVTDVQIPFWSLVMLLVKIAFASIPAVLIVGFVFSAIQFAVGFLMHQQSMGGL